jgi:hypothetical protein
MKLLEDEETACAIYCNQKCAKVNICSILELFYKRKLEKFEIC